MRSVVWVIGFRFINERAQIFYIKIHHRQRSVGIVATAEEEDRALNRGHFRQQR